MSRRSPGHALHRDERGAVAVIVALCAVVIFGFAAYAVDLGHLWQERRQAVTATDAAALASAGDYAVGGNGCSSSAGVYTAANQADASVIACDPTIRATSGYVTVSTKVNVPYFFGQIFGASSNDITTRTTAQWGIPKSVAGLRPFGLCIEANQQLKDWLANPVGSSGTVRITYGKSQPNACGTNVPGNWGVQDFDGGANSNNDIKNWTMYGYPGTVSVGDNILGDTGAFSNSLDSGLSFLKSSGQSFALPVFDLATGNGSNARFHIVAFVIVKLVDFKTTGAQAQRYMDLVFTNAVVSGTCCSLNGIDTGVRAIRICDVNTLTPNTSDPRAC